MRSLTTNLCVLFLLSVAAVAAQESSALTDGRYAPVRRGDLSWIQPGPKPVLFDGYGFSEAVDPNDSNRVDYIKGPGEREPKAFYKHGRSIGVALGHTHKTILINDAYTTKLQKVVVASLRDYTRTDVSSDAMRLYERDVKPDPRLIVNPEGYALSPDDRVVLIRIVLTHVSVDSAEQARQVGGTFTPRWYAVDCASGKVLRTFEGSNPPKDWYPGP
jgi:hypothetical protein